jgi:hypothetical protein
MKSYKKEKMNKPRPPNKAKLTACYEAYVCKVLNYMKEHFIKYTFTLFQQFN